MFFFYYMMTKGEIDRLGQRLGASKVVSDDDLEMLQAYRQTFQDPVSRVFSFVLAAARKIDRRCIVTFRIKRIDTIIEKLRRFQDNENGRMNLSRMWDIAGCRCIFNLSSTDEIYRLQKAILDEYGYDSKINDHINPPKDSGYRALHIYVKDKQTQQPIEIQIRNKDHHNWATLVEIVDLLYGTKHKEQGPSGKLGRFLCLYSKASDLSNVEFSEMLKTEREMKVFERMSEVLTGNYINIRRQWLMQNARGNYYVIIANKTRSEIISYQTFREAETSYYEKYRANRDCNIVLTHLNNPEFNQISMAYSNYVLAMHAFFDDYRVLVSEKIAVCVRENDYYNFFKDFRIYNSNLKCHFRNLALEVDSITACFNDNSISKKQLRLWQKDISSRLNTWQEETRKFIRSLANFSRGSRIKRWLVKNRLNQMAKAVVRGQKHKKHK